jgi:hypothetical protein
VLTSQSTSADRAGVRPYSYAEFLRRAAACRARRRRTGRATASLACGGMALAAAVLAVGIADRAAGRADGPSTRDGLLAREAGPRLVDARAAGSQEWAAQYWLDLLPAESAVVRVETQAAVDVLQERIAWIDDALTDSQVRGDTLQRIQSLHVQRGQLVDALVQVRYAERMVGSSR